MLHHVISQGIKPSSHPSWPARWHGDEQHMCSGSNISSPVCVGKSIDITMITGYSTLSLTLFRILCNFRRRCCEVNSDGTAS